MKKAFTMFSTLFVTGIALLGGSSCHKSVNDPLPADSTVIVTPAPMPADSNSKTYLALGDSYTIGQSVADSERFPAQTNAYLKAAGLNMQKPQYIATTGWTTAQLQSAIASINPKGPYDAVTLLIGVNDQYQHMDTAGYRVRFTQLLQKAIELAGNKITHVFVLSIPDYSVTPFGGGSMTIRKEIDYFNAINKQVTAFFNIAYVDITPSTRLAASDPSLIANDGLHPSGKEYKVWAQMLYPLMLQVLK